MDIDLLINGDGEVGIVAAGQFDSPVSGVIFDHAASSMTLEFAETLDSLPMNITVSSEFIPYLQHSNIVHFIALEKKKIVDARMVALMHVNDYVDDGDDAAEGGWA